jgi:tRNA uridine 5-carbamoylmethylation protein Kti12
MPLIVISGGPCSGKSTRAQALYEYFQTKSMPVQIITDNQLDRNAVYAGFWSLEIFEFVLIYFSIDNTLEKQARSDLKAETQR